MFIEKIKAAYEEQRLVDEGRRERQRLAEEAKIEKAIFALFGTKEGFTIDDGRVTFEDGLILRADWDGPLSFAVYGHCPKCGCEAWSPAARSLEHLGKGLLEFSPRYQHRCAREQQPQTVESDLAEALADFVRSVIEE